MGLRLRFLPTALVRGHWKALTLRNPEVGERDSYPADKAARAVMLAAPTSVGVVAGVVGKCCNTGHIDASWAGVVIAASALLSAALLGAFSLLGSWRSRLTQRAQDSETLHEKEWPLRALIDEAVAGTLVGVLDSVMLMVVTLIGVVVPDRFAFISLGLIVSIGAHIGLLFLSLISALYSAYTQSENVPTGMDGHV